ncbi:MAG: tetratricopeptide repeat protein [Candidatus Pacebacteria bacterium]|nr:tetratricopeptide repeat protein [Candidatus Paceibacterota bacterium]
MVLSPLPHRALAKSIPTAITAAPVELESQESKLDVTVAKGLLIGRIALEHDDYAKAQNSLSEAAIRQPDYSDLAQLANFAAINNGDLETAHQMALLALQAPNNEILPLLTEIIYGIKQKEPSNNLSYAQSLPRNDIGAYLSPLILAWVKAAKGQNSALADLSLTANPQLTPFIAQHQLAIAEFTKDRIRQEEALKHLLPKNDADFDKLSLAMIRIVGGYYERAGNIGQARKLYQVSGKKNNLYDLLAEDRQRLMANGPPPPALTPESGIAAVLLESGLLINNGRKEDRVALSLLRMAEWLEPKNPDIVLSIGDLLNSWELYEQALPIYQSMTKTANPQWRWQARIRYCQTLVDLKRNAEAEVELRKMSEEDRTDTLALSELGRTLNRSENYSAALKAYSDAIARVPTIGPDHWSLIFGKGISLERLGRTEEAIDTLKQAISLSPNQPDLLNYLGFTWVENNQNLNEALKMLVRAWQIKPNDSAITDSVGWAFYKLKYYDKAIEFLEQAVELSAYEPEIADHLGDAYWQVGREQEARVKWKLVLSLSPPKELLERVKVKLQNGIPLLPRNGQAL